MGKQNYGIISALEPTDDPVIITSVHGAFVGSVMPAARLEGLIAAHVPRKHIKDVADVYAHKWWDYRRLSPGHSYMLFIHCYYRAFKLAARTVLAHRAHNHALKALIGGGEVQFRPEEIWERDKSHITGMWKAMLVADALGMPYDRFCGLSFQVALDTAWTRLPRPQQLYSEKLAAQTLESWVELKKERLIIARHPLYKVENYGGAPVQDEYREWLIEAIGERDNKIVPVSTAVYTQPQLPESLAALHFTPAVMNRARLLAA